MTRLIRVPVRELVAFSERRGDINFRFSSRSTPVAGIRGHQRLQKRRGDGYVAEQRVADTVERDGIALDISGRVDGYFPGTEPLVVDEIKTVRGEAAAIPPAVTRLHRGQARVYGWLLGREAGASNIRLRVCYLQLDDDSEVQLEETLSLLELGEWYAELAERYLEWEIVRDRYRRQRNRTIDALPVPYGGFRPGQREMAVSVYRTLRAGEEAVIEAPTGIGKTMAALYPALRSLSSLDYDKIFFLTAKGSGRAAAREAIEDLRSEGLALTDVTLVAKEQACFNPGVPCHPEQCAYAAGYYDKLPEVLGEQASEARRFTPEAIAALAEDKGMCPFELSLDLAGIADVVIGDYNYAFDPWVHLRRFFDDSGGRHAFLVDEAHNLVDRGRDMFSAQLGKERVAAVRARVKSSAPLLARHLGSVNAAIDAVARENRDTLATAGYCVVSAFPDRLVNALRRFCDAAEEWLTTATDEVLLDCYFTASRFVKTLDLVDDHFRCLVEESGRGPILQVLAVNPAKGLRAGFQRAGAAVAFSATLSPSPYFRRLVGTKDEAAWLRVPSPFPAANLGVFVATHVSTRWRDRQDSLIELVDTIAEVVGCRPGNYLVFFPSYQYLTDALTVIQARHPELDCRSQQASMDGAAREDFVAAFRAPRSSPLVGFAVTGGVFGEGVDLKGEHLIGVIVVGVGLPGLSTERDLISASFGDGDRETGFRFAYQYPGINRVLQTAGRVIRSPEDRGIVCLIDPRFAESRYAQLLPDQWRVTRASCRHSLVSGINAFWNDDGAGVFPCSRVDNRRDGPDQTVSVHENRDALDVSGGVDATGHDPAD